MCVVRWLDDVMHAYPGNLSPGAMRALRRLQHKRFYGGTLELLEDQAANVAFGFWVQARSGVLLIREHFTITHVQNGETHDTADMWPLLAPVWQFGAQKTSYNTALGRLTRHLDTTNGAELDVVNGLKRILSELSSVGYSKVMMSKVVKQLSRTATLDLDPVLKFIEVDFNSMNSWGRTYDFYTTRLWNLKTLILGLRHRLLQSA